MLSPALADDITETDNHLESARQTFFSKVDDARGEVISGLDKKIETAKRSGDLDMVVSLTEERQAFVKQGSFPASINSRTFEREVAAALRSLTRQFDAAIRVYVQAGRIDEAKQLREELQSFKDSPLNRVNWGVAEYTIVSGAGSFKPFANGERAFPNRSYVWRDVSPTWPVKQFAPVPGGKTASINISITSPGWVLIAISNEDPKTVEAYLSKNSWQPTGFSFSYNARGKTPMAIYRKQLPKGDHAFPRLNFSGPVLLSP